MEALRLMHTDVARIWKVEDLASVASMSHSDFALRFNEQVGLPPLDYLIRWRIHHVQLIPAVVSSTCASAPWPAIGQISVSA